MKKEQTLDYNIKAAWHAIMRMYNQYGQEFDISATTGFVLLNIDTEEGTPATKIAPALGMEARSLTRTLKSLEDKGWICRQPDETDKRSIRVFLTDLGKHKRELSRNAVREFNFKVAEKITPEEIAVFFKVLKEITSTIECNDVFDRLAQQIKPEIIIES